MSTLRNHNFRPFQVCDSNLYDQPRKDVFLKLAVTGLHGDTNIGLYCLDISQGWKSMTILSLYVSF